MAVGRAARLALIAVILAAPGVGGTHAQAPTTDPSNAAGLPSLGKSPGVFRPDADEPDLWIFSGELQNSREGFSGTLVVKKGEAQFEMKLAGGATCDGEEVSGDIGLVRLSEIACSDDRTMRALFVPQGNSELKVFGHVGDERFAVSAHLLGNEPPPEKKQTAAPTVPALRHPAPEGAMPGGPSAPR